MSDLNIGLVGLGWVAGAHIETFKSVTGANVTAICSRRDHNEADLAAEFGTPLKAYKDYDQMLADPDIHIVDICTPHKFHADQAVAAAQAGKHLIIEKPICLTYDDAKRIRDAINSAGVQAMVCFECRYSAHFTMIRSIIDQGLLGELHYGEVDYYHGIGPWYGQFDWNVKKDFAGSSLLTAGCHALDACLFFMNGNVEEVTSLATGSKSDIFKPYEYKTTTVSLLKFEGSEKVAKVTSCVDCLQPYYFHIHLVGSEGSLLDNKIYSHKLHGMNKNKWSVLETSLIDSGDVSDHPYEPQFQAFIDSTNNNEPMPLTDFDTAFETHRINVAADLSAAEGRTVKLSELD
jgi:predicted dehydrogenase